MFEANTLAVIFIGLMGLSVLLYAVLDGYDLGVGILLPLSKDEDSDTMIASIGPFWDANETWLVLAIGLLLIAFPAAHSIIFKELYLPTAVLLISLVLRGVAFDFRAKAAFSHKPTWNKVFKIGSLLAALSQGYMLGMYVMGFENSLAGF
jgi:cytochrome d ubiquinol oxidase subunit II